MLQNQESLVVDSTEAVYQLYEGGHWATGQGREFCYFWILVGRADIYLNMNIDVSLGLLRYTSWNPLGVYTVSDCQ